MGPKGRHRKEGEAWPVPSGSSGMRGSVGSQSDGANQRHRKSHGGGRDEETAVTPVSSPPVASVLARHEVGLPCVGHTLLPQASAALGSGLQESSWLLPWGPSLLCPGLELFARHLLCLHFIRASALVSFPDHPVSNQDSLPSYPLHLPAFPALLFLTALAYLLVQCVIACPPPPPHLLEGPLLQCWDNVLFIPESHC